MKKTLVSFFLLESTIDLIENKLQIKNFQTIELQIGQKEAWNITQKMLYKLST